MYPRGCLRADFERMVPPMGESGLRWRMEVIGKLLVWPRMRAVALFRASQWLAQRRMLVAAYWLQSRAIRAAGTEISPLATIGPGLVIMHGSGIVIGPDVRIGCDPIIYQGVTLGDGSRPGQPTLGDRVFLGAGCSVLGGVQIGNDAWVAAGSIVTRDVPAGMLAVGSPAVLRDRRDKAPSTQGTRGDDSGT